MFLGQYHHSLDSKDRLTVPARFREMLGNCIYITMGFDKNLLALTEANFNAMSLSLQDKSLTDPLTRDLRRLIFSNASLLDVDNAGRILIPKYLRELVSISSEVVLVGQGDYIEVWSPDEWSKRMQLMQDEAIAERFATLDLATRHVTPTSTLQ
jgi:MraZ protein